MESVAHIAAAHGFAIASEEEIAEIGGTAHAMVHGASGAKLLYLRNGDANKAFSISFSTPAYDDTGVFHILEHSVLCGSRKFPVKEPFVNLLKTSMQTFLNAMTFPDKTMYPVASTNEQDLLNLMDVYLDAVFHPAIYAKRAIFEQEGWHVEVERDAGEDAAEAAEGEGERRLAYNGVVYNEMRGALSDPEAVLYNAISAALFPDTTYRFESGGTPEAIPTLTYEGFLDAHRRHYRADNSYLVLYGDLDLDRFLGFIVDGYLDPWAAEHAGEIASPERPGQDPVPTGGVDSGGFSVGALAEQCAVAPERTVVAMRTAPENACMALGYVVGTSAERERITAAGVLLDAIAGSNEAPLKRAILDAGIAADVQVSVADSILQPFALIELKSVRDNAAARFRPLVEEQARLLCEGGLDHEMLEAVLSRAEFAMREHDFGCADGVILAMSAMAGWLYDDDAPTDYLRYEVIFASLRAKIAEGYFERLLCELVLENGHCAEVELRPAPCDLDQAPSVGTGLCPVRSGEEDSPARDADHPAPSAPVDPSLRRLAELEASLDEAGFAAIEANVQSLRAAQEAPDAPEDVARLPRMTAADLGPAPEEGAFGLMEGTPVDCLRHRLDTRGISYFTGYFDFSCLSFDELPYAAVLAMVLGKLGTARRSAAELDVLVRRWLGSLGFSADVYGNVHDRTRLSPRFSVSAAALSADTRRATEIVLEVLLETDYSDHDRIRDILEQKRVTIEQGMASAGHVYALSRVGSYCLPTAVAQEQFGGMAFYRFLRVLLDDFGNRAPELELRLRDIAGRIFAAEGCLLSFAGGDEALESLWHGASALPRVRTGRTETLVVPEPVVRREAFVVPSDVTFTAMGFDRRLCGAPYSGAWALASRALSYDFLWNEVRVKGGAYGAGFKAGRAGSMLFYSYRDPRVDETVERFRAAGEWLSSFAPDAAEMEGFVVSTTAGIDAPLKPRGLMRRQDGLFLSGRDPAERAKTRAEVIAAAVQEVRAIGSVVSRATAENLVCTVGSREIIERSREGFDIVDVLGS